MKSIKFSSFFLIFFLIISCGEQRDKIEIYLLNKRIVSSDGVSLSKLDVYDSIPDNAKERFKFCTYDTVDSVMICAGKFQVHSEDVNEIPLIEDSEILRLNQKANTIEISKSGVDKITDVNPNNLKGTQFVICVNKQPLLTGYFISTFSSYIPTWNFISYLPKSQSKTTEFTNEEFVLNTNRSFRNVKINFINLYEYPELIKAFESSNRLEK